MRPEDFGKLILRLSIGGLLLIHGIGKLQHGLGFIESSLAAKGLPDALKYGVYAGEILGPALVILGFLGRLGAFMIVVNMAMAVFLVKMGAVAKVEQGAWGIELEALYLFGALAIMFLGSGKVSLRKGIPKID